jgi:ABC-type dipeptide/oligopeptide/nickel transport system permease component
MLRYALRRVLWAVPTLLATSLVLFFVTTLVPAPPMPADDDAAAIEAYRVRFLDLPRFVNTDPPDVRSRARAALAHVAAGDGKRDAASAELLRLGGAALPYVLPQLQALPPEQRLRVAGSLAPLADRMGLAEPVDPARPDAAVLFWMHFWDDRELDFTEAAVERAVERLVEHGSDLRESDLIAMDTFALPQIVHAMLTTRSPVALARLTHVARHATKRGPALRRDASAAEARRAVADWQEWWFVHRSDFVALDGAWRTASYVTETRYGKWLLRATSGHLGVSVIDGEPIADKLLDRARLTLLVLLVAMLASWLVAIPIGAYAAWRHGSAFDMWSSAVLFVLYATPTFAFAELLRRFAAGAGLEGARVALAVTALTLASLATLARWQRAAMLDTVRQDFVRTAKAKGVPGWRVAVVHALRNSLTPVVTLAGVHLPVLFGGALVVEEVFQLPGAGFETMRAIEARDGAWLMAVVLVSAVASTVGLVMSDVVCGVLDPRTREVLARRQGDL